MKNKLFNNLSLTLLTAGALLSVVGCGNNNTVVKPVKEYDYTYFNGICVLSGDFNSGVDKGLTNEWDKQACSKLGAKSARIWISLSGLFLVGENDALKVNITYKNVMDDHVKKLQEAGIENFLMMVTSYVYPTGYSASTGYVVPDPNEEYEYYLRWLNLQSLSIKKIYEMYPMIKNYEPANEPDFPVPACIHKNGYRFGGGDEVNAEFAYNDTEKVSIIADLCWYVRKALFEVDDKAKVSLPGLTNRSEIPDFLDLLYKRIESRCLPVAQKYADTDPDNYFDIVNWHPYPTQFHDDGTIDWDSWIEHQNSMYNVCKKHGDADKEVYLSELGWTDYGTDDINTLNEIASNYATVLPLIREKLKFVTVVFAFRLNSLLYQSESAAEKNYGIFYHPDDPNHHGAPKPAAYAIARYYHNDENYDIGEELKA